MNCTMASDHRALPDIVLDMYLYPIAAWGMLLVLLFIWELTAWALQLLMPLAIWQTALTAWWSIRTLRRFDRQELSLEEATAGALSVGRIIAATSVAPVVVFFGRDPFAPGAWSTAFGVLVIAGITWVGVQWLVKLRRRWSYMLAMAIGCMALPISATGSVTVGVMLGWYQVVVDNTPLPDVLTPLNETRPQGK
jgi:hypothetical protein